MITSKADLHRYLDEDLRANGLTRWKWWWRFSRPIVHWTRHLRRWEYVKNCFRARWQRPYVRLRAFLFSQHSLRMNYTIRANVFGPGLSIAYPGFIVVNSRARIGPNCRIHPGVSIGAAKAGTPIIGANAYLGPGAKLFGPIVLGDGVKVGANAVVTKSFGDGAVLVGVPARDISTSLSSHQDAQARLHS